MKKKIALLTLVVFLLGGVTGFAMTKWEASPEVDSIHTSNAIINTMFAERDTIIAGLRQELKDIGKNTVTNEYHEKVIADIRVQYETQYNDLFDKYNNDMLAKDLIIQDLKAQLAQAIKDVKGIDKALKKTIEANKLK